MEILDSNEVIIGSDNQPEIDNNKVTQSKHTTDRSAKMGHQPFDDKFWGTFGFSLYENEGESNGLRELLARLMFAKFKEWVANLDSANDGVAGEFGKWKKTAAKDFNDLEENEVDNDYKWADRIIELLKSSKGEEVKKDSNELSEEEMIKIAEDIISKRTDKSITDKKKTDKAGVMSDKVMKIKDLFSDLSDIEKGDLIKKLKE